MYLWMYVRVVYLKLIVYIGTQKIVSKRRIACTSISMRTFHYKFHLKNRKNKNFWNISRSQKKKNTWFSKVCTQYHSRVRCFDLV